VLPELTIVSAAALVFLGFLVGTFGTLIGAGGGFLLVPLLLIGYHFPPPEAVGTSLSLVFLNAASGSFAYLRQRRVDLSLGWKFAAATVPGAIGGAYLTRVVSSGLFSLAFATLLILLAVFLFSGIMAAASFAGYSRQSYRSRDVSRHFLNRPTELQVGAVRRASPPRASGLLRSLGPGTSTSK